MHTRLCARASSRPRVYMYIRFAAATAVLVYVSVEEKWEIGHATQTVVGGERVSWSGNAAFSSFLRGLLRGTLFSLGVGRLACSLFFYSILSAGLPLIRADLRLNARCFGFSLMRFIYAFVDTLSYDSRFYEVFFETCVCF